MNARPGLMVVVGLLGFCLAGCGLSEQAKAEREAAEAELKKLDGKWTVASREGALNEDDDGDKPPTDVAFYCVIENGVLREEFKGKDGTVDVFSRRKLVLMPTKTPKAVDLIYVDENGKEIKEKVTKKNFKGKKRTTTTVLKDVGIYKLDGNKLEMCISGDEKNRPTDFSAPAKSSRSLLKLERMDGKEAPAADKGEKDKNEKDKNEKDKNEKDKNEKDKNEK
jgi:uncharacterized protein (TIGR03067 family)